MSVRARLGLTLAGVAALLLLPTIYGLNGLTRGWDIVVDLRGRHAAARAAVGRLGTHLAELDRVARSYVITADPEFQSVVAERLVRSRTQLARVRAAGYRVAADRTAAAVDRLAEELRGIDRRVKAGDAEGAAARLDGVESRLERVRRSLDSVAAAIDCRSDAEVLTARRATSHAVATMLVALPVALVVAVALGAWSTRALTSPLRRLQRATGSISEGRLAVPDALPYDRRDEIGDLSRSFRSMTHKLAELDRVRAEFLSMASHDLKTPISVIHSYAEVFAQGTLGADTEKQAKVLETMQDQTACSRMRSASWSRSAGPRPAGSRSS